MEFYFGGAARSLFGVLHEPPRAPAQVGSAPRVLVLCAPLWREGVRAHRVLRQLGLRLAKEGFAVLRFDYSGAGDSAGESVHGDVDVWLEDIAAAIDEVRRRRRVARVSIYDNFFDLGGHSLLSTQVMHHVEQRLKKRLNVAELILQNLAQVSVKCDQAPALGASKGRGVFGALRRMISKG